MRISSLPFSPMYCNAPTNGPIRYVLSGTPNKITVASSATDFSVRWQVTTFNDRGTASGNDLDFTVRVHFSVSAHTIFFS